MKVEIIEVENAIDWNKSQVVVSNSGRRVQIATNQPIDGYEFCGIDLDTGEYSTGWGVIHFKPETKQDFPIKLELTIESEQDIINLWHRMNTQCNVINTAMSCSSSIKKECTYDSTLWNVLNQLKEERKIK